MQTTSHGDDDGDEDLLMGESVVEKKSGGDDEDSEEDWERFTREMCWAGNDGVVRSGVEWRRLGYDIDRIRRGPPKLG